jgi:hypothetical protein
VSSVTSVHVHVQVDGSMIRSNLKRVPWAKLTTMFVIALVVAWILGYLAGLFVRTGFGGL